MEWKLNDGGRSETELQETTGACVFRAIAIATGKPYQVVYDELMERCLKANPNFKGTGVDAYVMEDYIFQMGWEWEPIMPNRPLEDQYVPEGTVMLLVGDHLVASIDRVLHDAVDTRQLGLKMSGYYYKK